MFNFGCSCLISVLINVCVTALPRVYLNYPLCFVSDIHIHHILSLNVEIPLHLSLTNHIYFLVKLFTFVKQKSISSFILGSIDIIGSQQTVLGKPNCLSMLSVTNTHTNVISTCISVLQTKPKLNLTMLMNGYVRLNVREMCDYNQAGL